MSSLAFIKQMFYDILVGISYNLKDYSWRIFSLETLHFPNYPHRFTDKSFLVLLELVRYKEMFISFLSTKQ